MIDGQVAVVFKKRSTSALMRMSLLIQEESGKEQSLHLKTHSLVQSLHQVRMGDHGHLKEARGPIGTPTMWKQLVFGFDRTLAMICLGISQGRKENPRSTFALRLADYTPSGPRSLFCMTPLLCGSKLFLCNCICNLQSLSTLL